MRHTITQRLLFGLLATLAFIGSAGCTDEYTSGGKGDKVPLRLTASFLSTADSLQTRASTTPFEVQVALSITSGSFATNAKTYVGTDNGSGIITFAPKTEQDKLMVSRLKGSTPLTIWGEHSNGKPLFCSYAGATLTVDGAVGINLDDARSQVAVRVKSQGKYMTAGDFTVSTNLLQLPKKDANGKYVWATTGSQPMLAVTPQAYATAVKNTVAETISAVNEQEWMTICPTTVGKSAKVFTLTIGGNSYEVTIPNDSFKFATNSRYLITVNFDKGVAIEKIDIQPMTEKEDIDVRENPGIYSLQDLKDFRDAWNANGKPGIEAGKYTKWVVNNTVNLYADIDLNNEAWTPIYGVNANEGLTLDFNGNNHTISNLQLKITKIEVESTQFANFCSFICIASGKVSSLTINNLKANATSMPDATMVMGGSIAAIASTIENCKVTGKIDVTLDLGSQMGGFGGIAFGADVIRNCHVLGSNTSHITLTGASAMLGGILVMEATEEPVKILGCQLDGVALTSGFILAGISNITKSKHTIVGCAVTNAQLIAPLTNYGSSRVIGDITNSKGCVAYNITKLQGSSVQVFNASSTGCFFQNIAGQNNGTGHCASVNDLNAKISTMNDALYNYSPTFGYHYEEVNGYPALVEGNPQLPGIYSLQDLKDFRDTWNANDGLNESLYTKWIKNKTLNIYADIDMTGETNWEPIGHTDRGLFYDLTVEGNGHTIKNLPGQTGNYRYNGIIGQSLKVRIQNLTLVNMKFIGANVGGFVGLDKSDELSNATVIYNCHVERCTFTEAGTDGGFIGGIIGGGSPIIEACTVSNTTMKTRGSIGGIKGDDAYYNHSKTIGCIVSGCTITDNDGYNYLSGIDNNKTPPSTACVVYNFEMIGDDTNAEYYASTYKAIARNHTNCFFFNVETKNEGVLNGTTGGTGYCSSASVLNGKISTLNTALKNYSSTFGYHYEVVSGYPALVPGNP